MGHLGMGGKKEIQKDRRNPFCVMDMFINIIEIMAYRAYTIDETYQLYT